LLDLGGGTGAATEVFAHGASEIVVVEPEPARVARGRESHPTISFIEGPAENLPFADRRFDRVVSSLSFHHFEDGARVLSEAYRVLRPGGSLFVLDVEAESWRGRLFRFLHSFSRHGDLSFSAPSEVDGWLARAGFVEVRRDRLGPYYLLTARK
jgi:ubiquinone/menaquinone biosynthesis C-methylase UbiE